MASRKRKLVGSLETSANKSLGLNCRHTPMYVSSCAYAYISVLIATAVDRRTPICVLIATPMYVST